MKRFDPLWPDNNYGGDMCEEVDGEWVRYEDAQEEIKKLAKLLMEGRSIVNEQAAEIERLEARYYAAMDNVKFVQAKMDKDK